MSADVAPTVLSLCSGYGGLELAVRAVYPDSRVVGYVEWEAFSAAVLLARMEDASLEPAPIWCGDLAELPTAPFLGVDLVTAGFPCQPWSAAGRGAGTDDERWIWPDIAALLRRVRPGAVYLENVSPLISRGGLGLVLADLAALGFDAQWTVLRASDVGAPHIRERVFILAYASSARRPEVARSALSDEGFDAGWPPFGGDIADRGGEDVALSRGDAFSGQRGLLDGQRATPRHDANGRGGTELVDADGPGRQGDRRARTNGGRVVAPADPFPPGPDDRAAWELMPPSAQPSLRRPHGRPVLNPRMVSALMGLRYDWTLPVPLGTVTLDEPSEARSREVLRLLQKEADPQTDQRQARGPRDVPPTQVLRPTLYGACTPQGGPDTAGVPDPCAEVSQTTLRKLWDDAQAQHPSRGQGLAQQRPEQPSDALFVLSHLIASRGARYSAAEVATALSILRARIESQHLRQLQDEDQAYWIALSDAERAQAVQEIAQAVLVAYWLGTAHASVDDQLRTLGNGVVPQQAEAALRILAERMREAS